MLNSLSSPCHFSSVGGRGGKGGQALAHRYLHVDSFFVVNCDTLLVVHSRLT